MCEDGGKHHRSCSLLIRVHLWQLKGSALASWKRLTERIFNGWPWDIYHLTCATVNTNITVCSHHNLKRCSWTPPLLFSANLLLDVDLLWWHGKLSDFTALWPLNVMSCPVFSLSSLHYATVSLRGVWPRIFHHPITRWNWLFNFTASLKALYQNDGNSVSPLTPPWAARSSEKTFLYVCVCGRVCLFAKWTEKAGKYKSNKVMITLALTLWSIVLPPRWLFSF